LIAAAEFEMDPEHMKQMEDEMRNAENAPIDDGDEEI
jgi:hypothetical protein